MNKFDNYDLEKYKKFTFPMELDKSIHALEGIIKGISIDNNINSKEVEMLKNWCEKHRDASEKHPFNELLPLIELSLQDNIFTEEEKKDILWLCKQCSTQNTFFDSISADMQRLQGILAGITADEKIKEEELRNLSNWLYEHENLKTCWPYDEICSLITSVMSDQKIDEEEHTFLMAFFGDFMKASTDFLIKSEMNENQFRQGICAVCPEIKFENQCFCFTGKSSKASRKEMAKIVKELKGLVASDMKKEVDYLIIGSEGNNCWAFSCYGRKVEEAVALRRKGVLIQLIHENDFWDAVEDEKAKIK